MDKVAAEIERLGQRQHSVLARAFGQDEPLGLAVSGQSGPAPWRVLPGLARYQTFSADSISRSILLCSPLLIV